MFSGESRGQCASEALAIASKSIGPTYDLDGSFRAFADSEHEGGAVEMVEMASRTARELSGGWRFEAEGTCSLERSQRRDRERAPEIGVGSTLDLIPLHAKASAALTLPKLGT